MSSLRVCTWNLCGLEERALDERTEQACFALLLHDPPDVVLLQEVVRRSLFAHLRPHFHAAGFTLAPAEPLSDSEYFCAIAVRAGLTPRSAWRRPFPGSQMGRALLGLEVDWEGTPLLLTTAHLESLRTGEAERRRQVSIVLEALVGFDGLALFGGDTNLRDDVDGPLAAAGVHDAWAALQRPREGAITWWPMGVRAPRSSAKRFDRIWLGPGLRVQGMRVGGDRRAGGLRLSDHLFVEATVAR